MIGRKEPDEEIRIGAYRLVRRLGAGGMGEVQLAVHVETGEQAAIKVLRMSGEGEAARRFRREIALCAGVDHPNVIRIFEGGIDDGTAYYAMEYLPRPSLGAVLKKGAQIGVPRALRLLRGLSEALRCIHQRQLLHRDVKPDNCLVADDDRLVLADFGLATEPGRTVLTKTGEVVGTPMYLAPEIWRGNAASPASDVFSAGLVAYEMLGRKRPFDGPSLKDVAARCVKCAPTPLKTLRPDLSDALCAIVDRCLAKDPAARFVDGGALVKALATLDDDAQPLPAWKPRLTGRSFVGIILAVAAFAALFLVLRRKSPPVARNLRVEKGFEAIRVSWRSHRPYPSRVEVTDGATGTVQRVEGSCDDAARHRVDVRSLRPGRRYDLRVLFPDGSRTMGSSIRLRPFKIALEAVQSEAGALLLRWTTSIDGRSHLLMQGDLDRKPELFPVSVKPSRRHEATVDWRRRPLRRLALLIESDLGEKLERDLTRELGNLVRRHEKALSFDAGAVASETGSADMGDLFGKEAAQFTGLGNQNPAAVAARRRRRGRALTTILERRQTLKAFSELRPFLPFLLEAGVLPSRRREQVYRCLVNLAYLKGYAFIEKLPFSLPVEGALGSYATSAESRLAHPRIFRANLKRPLRLETPRPLVEKRPCHTSFRIHLRGAKRALRAELAVYRSAGDRGGMLRCKLNGEEAFVLMPARSVFQPIVHVGINPRWLKDGENVLDLKVECIPGVVSWRWQTYDAVALRLEP